MELMLVLPWLLGSGVTTSVIDEGDTEVLEAVVEDVSDIEYTSDLVQDLEVDDAEITDIEDVVDLLPNAPSDDEISSTTTEQIIAAGEQKTGAIGDNVLNGLAADEILTGSQGDFDINGMDGVFSPPSDLTDEPAAAAPPVIKEVAEPANRSGFFFADSLADPAGAVDTNAMISTRPEEPADFARFATEQGAADKISATSEESAVAGEGIEEAGLTAGAFLTDVVESVGPEDVTIEDQIAAAFASDESAEVFNEYISLEDFLHIFSVDLEEAAMNFEPAVGDALDGVVADASDPVISSEQDAISGGQADDIPVLDNFVPGQDAVLVEYFGAIVPTVTIENSGDGNARIIIDGRQAALIVAAASLVSTNDVQLVRNDA